MPDKTETLEKPSLWGHRMKQLVALPHARDLPTLPGTRRVNAERARPAPGAAAWGGPSWRQPRGTCARLTSLGSDASVLRGARAAEPPEGPPPGGPPRRRMTTAERDPAAIAGYHAHIYYDPASRAIELYYDRPQTRWFDSTGKSESRSHRSNPGRQPRFVQG